MDDAAVGDLCRRARAGGQVLVRDLPMAGQPVVLLWSKRIWRCRGGDCEKKTCTETSELIAPTVLVEASK